MSDSVGVALLPVPRPGRAAVGTAAHTVPTCVSRDYCNRKDLQRLSPVVRSDKLFI